MLSHGPVNLLSLLKKILLALCVLALVTAQLFGIGSGFLCDCTGAPVLMASDHCHGPHGKQCHAEAIAFHSGENCTDGGDMQPHEKVETEFRSPTSPSAAVVMTGPLLRVVFVLNAESGENADAARTLKYQADERGSPASDGAVSRTVVLLI